MKLIWSEQPEALRPTAIYTSTMSTTTPTIIPAVPQGAAGGAPATPHAPARDTKKDGGSSNIGTFGVRLTRLSSIPECN